MKKKWLKLVENKLRFLGYNLTDTWRVDRKCGTAFVYVKKCRTYYAVTVATCTGLLLVEILKSHYTLRINEDSVLE